MSLLKQPLQRNFPLDDIDPELDPDRLWNVDVRQATQAEIERRADINSVSKQVFQAGDTAFTVEQRFSYPEQQRKEVYLTLAGCNITIEDPSEKSGERPLFKFARRSDGKMGLKMSEDEFSAAWGLLPGEVADSIHDKVLKVNPNWDPKKALASTKQ